MGKPVVYIAHPYNGITGSEAEKFSNVESNRRLVLELAAEFDIVPVSPLLLFTPLIKVVKEGDMLEHYCLPLLDKCDELFLTGRWEVSQGCLTEKKRSAATKNQFG